MTRTPLCRDEVTKAIEHRCPSRVPMILHHYAPLHNFPGQEDELKAIFAEYPMDVMFHNHPMPDVWERPWSPAGYSWTRRQVPALPDHAVGLDAEIAMEDWSQLPEILAHTPDPTACQPYPASEDPFPPGDRYQLLHWWNCLYEKAWKLRGMENLLMDFHLYPREVHQLLEAITDFSCGVIRAQAAKRSLHGVWVTDDLGTQAGPMFGLATFREFFKPCFEKLIRTAHECNMHFWLHSCGNMLLFMEDFIEIGLDVIHPIQKYAMNELEVASQFGGRICFWAGMDVQKILPRGSVEDVRREVRFMLDTYDRPDGGCLIALGNVASKDVPVENLRAFFDESYISGLSHRQGRAGTR